MTRAGCSYGLPVRSTETHSVLGPMRCDVWCALCVWVSRRCVRCTNCTAVHALGGRDRAFSTAALERSTDRRRTHETRISALRPVGARPGLRVNAKVQLYGDGGCRLAESRVLRCPIANGNACMDVPVDVPFPLGTSRRADPHPAVGVAACNKNTVTFHNRVGTGYSCTAET